MACLCTGSLSHQNQADGAIAFCPIARVCPAIDAVSLLEMEPWACVLSGRLQRSAITPRAYSDSPEYFVPDHGIAGW